MRHQILKASAFVTMLVTLFHLYLIRIWYSNERNNGSPPKSRTEIIHHHMMEHPSMIRDCLSCILTSPIPFLKYWTNMFFRYFLNYSWCRCHFDSFINTVLLPSHHYYSNKSPFTQEFTYSGKPYFCPFFFIFSPFHRRLVHDCSFYLKTDPKFAHICPFWSGKPN